jgi:phosphinothricin acetyltransferase
MHIRPATLADLPSITALINHYIVNSHITFDIAPYTTAEREPWFHEHSDGGRYRMLVAEDEGELLGYAATGPFRKKGAYDTTVEVSVACCQAATGRHVGTQLYAALFDEIAGEDIHRIIAVVVPPNPASMALHERFGFRPAGSLTAVGRKFDRYWDVVLLERPLRLLDDPTGGSAVDPRPTTP